MGCTNYVNDTVILNKGDRKPGKLITEKSKYSDTTWLDTSLFNKKLLDLVNGKPTTRWPVRKIYPKPGAILPFNRIVAYYGNFFAASMGVLGAFPENQMLDSLTKEVTEWHEADTSTPVIPAIHYITVTAQKNSGVDKKYRLRMPDRQVEKAIELAGKINGIVILDVQVGQSTLEQELPLLEKYLRLPQVHLGIDPEYSMKVGQVPSSTIGTFDAKDINYASAYLASIVMQHNLPPKILVVHRFTIDMVTNYKQVELCPEVQIVMNMDGFGFPAKKKNTYKYAIARQPVQFTGFKIFYKQDTEKLMTPEEILKLYPKPIYIQYQ